MMTTAADDAGSDPPIINKFFQYQCSSSEGCPCSVECSQLHSACEYIQKDTLLCLKICGKIQNGLNAYRDVSYTLTTENSPTTLMDQQAQSIISYAVMSTTNFTAATPSTDCTLSCIFGAGAIGALIFSVIAVGIIGVAYYWRCRRRHDPPDARRPEDGENVPLTGQLPAPSTPALARTQHSASENDENVPPSAEPNTCSHNQQMQNCNSSNELTPVQRTVATQTGSLCLFAERLKTFEVQGRGVFAVARLDSEIFLLQTEDDSILVYEASKPYRFIKSIKIEGMINPSDLLACEENHSLYVTDDAPHPGFKMRNPPTAGCLWRIQLDGEQKHDQLLLSEKDWRPRALSRTSNGNILITTKHDDHRIYICDLNGEQLKKLFLPKAVFDPEHIIEGSHIEFIVCHRVHKGDNSMPLIVRLKIDPKDETVEKRLIFAEKPRMRDDLHLDRPEHMVRLQDGRIIVADFYKDRVLILTGDLKLQEILLQSTENDRSIDRPCRLSYDAQKRELLVAFHHTADLFKLTLPGS